MTPNLTNATIDRIVHSSTRRGYEQLEKKDLAVYCSTQEITGDFDAYDMVLVRSETNGDCPTIGLKEENGSFNVKLRGNYGPVDEDVARKIQSIVQEEVQSEVSLDLPRNLRDVHMGMIPVQTQYGI